MMGDFLTDLLTWLRDALLGPVWRLVNNGGNVNDALNRAMSYLGDLIWGAFDYVTAFVFGFLPDADSGIVQTINSWAYVLSGSDLGFNIYYFVDMPLVLVFLSVWTAVTVAGLVIIAVRFVLDVVHKVMDSIPIIG